MLRARWAFCLPRYRAGTSSGGVVLCCQDGQITVDNTLETRLKLVLDAEKPALRKQLFPRA